VPRTLNARYRERGTRFLLYPQSRDLPGFSRPVTVYVDATPGTIGAGPADQIMQVVDATEKEPYTRPHGPPRGKPPYRGRARDPVPPGPDGHFDHVCPGTEAFSATAAFASARCTLEVWESYFGRQIPWHFRRDHPRLEVIPRVKSRSAWAGYGFVEFGRLQGLLCENFDVVAHEVGHCLVRSVMGRPTAKPLAFQAFDEATADVIAVIASLHFEEVVEHLMANTRGNLFSTSILSRVGELNRQEHVRNVLNDWTMDRAESEFVDDDRRKYQLSLPLSGAAFDVLVEIYEQGLLGRGAVPEALVARSRAARRRDLEATQREFQGFFRRDEAAFTAALLDARDYFGRLLARTWEKAPLADLTGRPRAAFGRFAGRMLDADAELSGGRNRSLIERVFQGRGIAPMGHRNDAGADPAAGAATRAPGPARTRESRSPARGPAAGAAARAPGPGGRRAPGRSPAAPRGR
jgi:hypothetical protein